MPSLNIIKVPKSQIKAIADEIKIQENPPESLAHLVVELDTLREQKQSINADMNEQIKELQNKILTIAKGQLELEFK